MKPDSPPPGKAILTEGGQLMFVAALCERRSAVIDRRYIMPLESTLDRFFHAASVRSMFGNVGQVLLEVVVVVGDAGGPCRA